MSFHSPTAEGDCSSFLDVHTLFWECRLFYPPTWATEWGDEHPSLGGYNLQDILQEPRTFSFISFVFSAWPNGRCRLASPHSANGIFNQLGITQYPHDSGDSLLTDLQENHFHPPLFSSKQIQPDVCKTKQSFATQLPCGMKNDPLNTFGIETTAKNTSKQTLSRIHLVDGFPGVHWSHFLLFYFCLIAQYFVLSLTWKPTNKLNSIHYFIWWLKMDS